LAAVSTRVYSAVHPLFVSGAAFMNAPSRVAGSLVGTLRKALVAHALPGEIAGFGEAEQTAAAEFVAATAARRRPGTVALHLESSGGEVGHRRMRLAIVNDDMPFLVDSIAGAITARGLAVHRLLHPIIHAQRDSAGVLQLVNRKAAGTVVESIVYIELDRADARIRHELESDLLAVLADVRAAVADWPEMTQRMVDDATALDDQDKEGAALLRWLADHHFTLLGHAELRRGGKCANGLGVLRRDLALWDGGDGAAIDHLAASHWPVQILKADRLSPVHRRVPLDVVLVRLGKDSVSIHTGLWTSAARRCPAHQVPVLRQWLAELDGQLGFAPTAMLRRR